MLALKPADLMERRLQTQVFKLGLAKSIHHARVLIRAPAGPKLSRVTGSSRAYPPPHPLPCITMRAGARPAAEALSTHLSVA